ncbi:reticulon-2a isoform X1 [Electrophorus electricus]|uniref:Reticulon n=1 Tax=Electrophorus electricus TaxID=8005 RepID=A0A4W4H0I2_ELEEL|nr:reticulon-2a isoform X1 [Electrophorus electricus]
MGQVLGFSHCKELGSVSSTPDSTPPCTDGGNEESDFPELLTAREWSEDEEGPEDEDGSLSSPSVWGTPRQNSFELTFSYIAFSEGEASSRRETGRRRGCVRGRRTDTVDVPEVAESPAVDWDPQAFLTGEGEQEEERDVEMIPEPAESVHQSVEPSVEGKANISDQEMGASRGGEEIPDRQTPCITEPHELPVSMETTATSLTEVASNVEPPPIGQNTQEELTSEQWFSTLNQSEQTTVHIQIAVMDILYWKDMEQTGLVLTGLVVTLLSLVQLSIVSVLSTLSLVIMCFTISVRIYCSLLHCLQLRDGAHPFKSYLDMEIGLGGDKAEHLMQRAIVLTCSALDTLKRLVFVFSLFDSLKFLLLMYLVTYLGALCNGLTLLIIGVIAVFSVPLFYRQYQGKIDSLCAVVQSHVDNIKDILNRLAQGGGPTPDSTPGGAKPKTL